jgi:hypothetical protein
MGVVLRFGFAAVIAAAAVGASASDVSKGWGTKTEGAAPSGWTWVGESEQQNFAIADRFCRGMTVAADLRLKFDV